METSIQTFLARTLVLIPAFNEEASLPGLLAEVRAQLPGTAVAVVDDGSADGTAAAASAGGARVLRLPCNLGVGPAVQIRPTDRHHQQQPDADEIAEQRRLRLRHEVRPAPGEDPDQGGQPGQGSDDTEHRGRGGDQQADGDDRARVDHVADTEITELTLESAQPLLPS